MVGSTSEQICADVGRTTPNPSFAKEGNFARAGILLVGPYPPPHGGISVHVRNAHAVLTNAGMPCAVLNTENLRPLAFVCELIRRAFDDWTVHIHTNGHNPKSWVVALAGGIAAQFGASGVLTLHSGFVPDFLNGGPLLRRGLARLTCLLYKRVVCVSRDIADAVVQLGIPERNVEVMPAYLHAPASISRPPSQICDWMAQRRPVISAALCFRPEYGFDVLADAIDRLRHSRPRIGCVVMGGGEEREAAEDLIRSRNLSDALLLTGDIDHNICLDLMSRSDLFVRATYQDGDAISVREALALGLPVVASNVGHRPAGTLLFEPGDVESLAARIEEGLQTPASMPKAEGDQAIQRLLEMYACSL